MSEQIDDYEENLVKIVEDGKEYVFEELDRVEYEGKKYIALIPIDEEIPDDDEDGNVIILEVTESGDEQLLSPITDDKIFNEVGNIIEDRLIEKYENDDDVTVQKRND